MCRQAVAQDGAIVCHSTFGADEAVCRGFYERYSTNPIRWAERLGAIREVDPPGEHSLDCQFCAAGEPLEHQYEPPTSG
jgi:hypothetical protein